MVVFVSCEFLWVGWDVGKFSHTRCKHILQRFWCEWRRLQSTLQVEHWFLINMKIITGHNEVVAKVMFLHVCVILFTGFSGDPPGPGRPSLGPGRPPPPDQADPPGSGRNPPDQADPPRPGRHPPAGRIPPEEDCSVQSLSGRNASYWNAFLFYNSYLWEKKFSYSLDRKFWLNFF